MKQATSNNDPQKSTLPDDQDPELYKNTCKVIANDPLEYDKIDPFNCKYYFPSMFKMF
jgi:hypothetical protein